MTVTAGACYDANRSFDYPEPKLAGVEISEIVAIKATNIIDLQCLLSLVFSECQSIDSKFRLLPAPTTRGGARQAVSGSGLSFCTSTSERRRKANRHDAAASVSYTAEHANTACIIQWQDMVATPMSHAYAASRISKSRWFGSYHSSQPSSRSLAQNTCVKVA